MHQYIDRGSKKTLCCRSSVEDGDDLKNASLSLLDEGSWGFREKAGRKYRQGITNKEIRTKRSKFLDLQSSVFYHLGCG